MEWPFFERTPNFVFLKNITRSFDQDFYDYDVLTMGTALSSGRKASDKY